MLYGSAKSINRVYLNSKLIRRLYFKSSKKDDDVLQNMIGMNRNKNRRATDPMMMKTIKFKLSDYFGKIIQKCLNFM